MLPSTAIWWFLILSGDMHPFWYNSLIICLHRGSGAEQNVMRWCVCVHTGTSASRSNPGVISHRITTQAKRSRSHGLMVVKLGRNWLQQHFEKYSLVWNFFTTFAPMNRSMVGQTHTFGDQRGVVRSAVFLDAPRPYVAAMFIGCVPRRQRIFFQLLRIQFCFFLFSSLECTSRVVSIMHTLSFMNPCLACWVEFVSSYPWQWLSYCRSEWWIRACGCHQGGLGRVGYCVIWMLRGNYLLQCGNIFLQLLCTQ